MKLLIGEFHVDGSAQVRDYERLLVKPEVFSSVLNKRLLISNYFAMVSVNDRIGFLGEPINPANLIKIFLPFGRMFDYNTEVDIFILGFDPSCYLLTISCIQTVGRACDYVTTHKYLNIIFIIRVWIIWSRGYKKYQLKYSNNRSKPTIKRTC